MGLDRQAITVVLVSIRGCGALAITDDALGGDGETASNRALGA